MRSISLTFLYVLFCMAVNGQNVQEKDKTDLAKDKIRGKVKSMSVTGFTVIRKDGKLQKGRKVHTATSTFTDKGYLLEFNSTAGDDTVQNEFIHFKAARSLYRYDNNGVLVSNSRYNGDGTLQDSASYKVDSKGNRIDWNTYKGDGTLEWNYSREYDLQGNLVESNEFFKGALKSRHTYKYDEKLNIKEENFYEADGRLKLKELFKYDDKRNVVEITDYDRTGVFKAKYTYAYDAKGNQVEEREFDGENSTKYKKILTHYDNENNIIEVTQYNEKGKVTYECKLDKLGNHIADATYKPDGTLIEKITQKYKYDDHENEVENERLNAKGKPAMKVKNIYTYDKEGNWFIKIVYENDKPKRITERIFDYY
jgi:hypothetical protein